MATEEEPRSFWAKARNAEHLGIEQSLTAGKNKT